MSIAGLAAACTGTDVSTSPGASVASADLVLDRLVLSGRVLDYRALAAHSERLVVTSGGGLLSVDPDSHRVAEIGSAGEELWSLAEQGAGTGQLNAPTDAVELAGSRFVVDRGNHRIVRFDAAGNWIAAYGEGLNFPFGIDADAQGRLWLSDSMNHQLVRLDGNGQEQWRSAAPDYTHGSLNGPRGVAVDRNGYIHVADSGWGRVSVFDPEGRVSTTYGADVGLIAPRGVAADPEGRVYVADPVAAKVFAFADGRLESEWTPQHPDLEFVNPTGVSIVGDSLVVTLAQHS